MWRESDCNKPLHTSTKCEKSEKEMINDDNNTVGICLPTLTNICGALIWLPFSITMVIVGLLYYNHCDYSQASIWLTISGAYCIIEFSIRIYIHFVSNEDYSDFNIFSFAMRFGLFLLWGSVIIFGKAL